MTAEPSADEATVREALASFRAEIRGRYNDYEISDAEDALTRFVTRTETLRLALQNIQGIALNGLPGRQDSELLDAIEVICSKALGNGDCTGTAEQSPPKDPALAAEARLREAEARVELLLNCDCVPLVYSSRSCPKCGRNGVKY